MNLLACLTPDIITLLQKHQLLQPLVKADLIEGELASVELTPEQSENLFRDFCKQQNIEYETSFDDWLSQRNVKREELLQQISAPFKLTEYCKERFIHKAEARFIERKQGLDEVVYSLLRVKDPFQARELYLRIAEGEVDFGSLAAQFSEGREKDSRGIIGPVPLVQAHPSLVELLRSSKAGELREPIQIEGWNLIVRLESYQSATLDQSMEQRMAQELFAQWVDEEVGRRIETMMAETSSAEARGSTPPTP